MPEPTYQNALDTMIAAVFFFTIFALIYVREVWWKRTLRPRLEHLYRDRKPR